MENEIRNENVEQGIAEGESQAIEVVDEHTNEDGSVAVNADGEIDAGAGTEPDAVEPCGEGCDEPRTAADIATLVAEAEHRGYLRGRNERIERLMAQPGVWEEEEPQPMILSRLRRSVWD